MNDDNAPVMILYPDASVCAVWEFLNEVSNSFERHYAVQLRQLLNAREHPSAQCDSSDEGPF